MTNKTQAILVLAVAVSFLPVFRSGLRDHLNFWEFVYNHTIWGPPVEYIPEEDYAVELGVS